MRARKGIKGRNKSEPEEHSWQTDGSDIGLDVSRSANFVVGPDDADRLHCCKGLRSSHANDTSQLFAVRLRTQ